MFNIISFTVKYCISSQFNFDKEHTAGVNHIVLCIYILKGGGTIFQTHIIFVNVYTIFVNFSIPTIHHSILDLLYYAGLTIKYIMGGVFMYLFN